MQSKTNDEQPEDRLTFQNGQLPGIVEEKSDDEGDYTVGLLTAGVSVVRFRNLRKKYLKRNHGVKILERRYTELGPRLKPEHRRIDYILVYENKSSKDEIDPDRKKSLEDKEAKRERFTNAMKQEGFLLKEMTVGRNVFVKIHCPFKRLCVEAEMVKLEKPLKGCEKAAPNLGCFGKFIEEHFETDNEVDFVSAPFVMERIQLYEGYEDPTNFFRSSVRSMLVHHILINLDIRDNDDKANKVLQIRGLRYLLMKRVYTDAFSLHEESSKSKYFEETRELMQEEKTDVEEIEIDPRKDLDEAWKKWYKFQPLWKIRNYFGEKIALYFAWTGMLTASLWIPTIAGFTIFLYGLIQSQISENDPLALYGNETALEELKIRMKDLFKTVKLSFDNDATPGFAFGICIWGTVFLELWKRTNATLAYEWDVDNFEINEPDRPQFYGLKVKTDPITSEENWIYPFKRVILKYIGSTMFVIFMILVVFACVAAIIVYRVVVSIDYCPSVSATECVLVTTVASSILNGLIILLLGKIYDIVAVELTNWENHRTQSRYDDALIIKIFAFQFANTYASCFYIAFLRGKYNIFALDSEYKDECSDTCMSQLSIQVMILMIIKPFPKFLKDIILPFVRKMWRNRPNWCCRYKCCHCCQCCQNKIKDVESLEDKSKVDQRITFDYVENERLKPLLGDFTLSEYTEKILQYGFLMLFAASFPLAPLLALLTNAIDIRVDAKRLLWMYRRPIAEIRGDIGRWYGILEFVNLCGVVTNGFIIAFTSSWAEDYTTVEKLWLVIAFEHTVFALKFLMAYFIPDVPSSVALDIRREKFQVAKLLGTSTLSKGGNHEIVDYSELVPKHCQNRPQRSSNYDSFPESDDGKSVSQKIVEREKERAEEAHENLQHRSPNYDNFTENDDGMAVSQKTLEREKERSDEAHKELQHRSPNYDSCTENDDGKGVSQKTLEREKERSEEAHKELQHRSPNYDSCTKNDDGKAVSQKTLEREKERSDEAHKELQHGSSNADSFSENDEGKPVSQKTVEGEKERSEETQEQHGSSNADSFPENDEGKPVSQKTVEGEKERSEETLEQHGSSNADSFPENDEGKPVSQKTVEREKEKSEETLEQNRTSNDDSFPENDEGKPVSQKTVEREKERSEETQDLRESLDKTISISGIVPKTIDEKDAEVKDT